MSSITSTVTESTDIDALLGRIELFGRGDAIKEGVSDSLEPPLQRVKELCPKGGPRIGTKEGKKHLADTYRKQVRIYRDGTVVVGLVGAQWPAGAHSHNVEFGHNIVRAGKIVGRAQPRPHVRPAAEQTQGAQVAAFEATLAEWAAEASK